MVYIFKKFHSVVCASSDKLGFVAMAALALVLAIGANSAAFSTLDVFPLTDSNSSSIFWGKSLRPQSISGTVTQASARSAPFDEQVKADISERKEQINKPNRPQIKMDYADLIRNYSPGNPLDRVSSGAF